jgi:protein tyrosine phosphatase (PTP) superfamily phosphohydrolase (DUF442 family)
VDKSAGKRRDTQLKLRLALAAVISITIAAYGDCPTDGTGNNTAPQVARRISADGVPKMAEVTARLFRGGQPSEKGFETLAQMGIKIIVDGRGKSPIREHEREIVRKLGMRYVTMPWHCPFPKDDVFARFLQLIRDNPDSKIFVHCNLGDDRVGMMIAAYRMAYQGWTADQAMQEMKCEGFSWSHHLICPGLARYEKTFPYRLKTSPKFRLLR